MIDDIFLNCGVLGSLGTHHFIHEERPRQAGGKSTGPLGALLRRHSTS